MTVNKSYDVFILNRRHLLVFFLPEEFDKRVIIVTVPGQLQIEIIIDIEKLIHSEIIINFINNTVQLAQRVDRAMQICFICANYVSTFL